MSHSPNLFPETHSQALENLPVTDIFSVKRGNWLGQSRVAKSDQSRYDHFDDRQPQVEILDPSSGELKTAVVGVHKAIQLKAAGRKEPIVHG